MWRAECEVWLEAGARLIQGFPDPGQAPSARGEPRRDSNGIGTALLRALLARRPARGAGGLC